MGKVGADLLDARHVAPIYLPFSWQEKGPGDELVV